MGIVVGIVVYYINIGICKFQPRYKNLKTQKSGIMIPLHWARLTQGATVVLLSVIILCQWMEESLPK